VLSFFIAHSAYAEFRVDDLGVVMFQQNAWDKGAPDAAGCITYTANRDDADLNLDSPERLLRAPRNATVIFCNGAVHLAANIVMVAQFRAVNPGFWVSKFRSITFQGDWLRAGPASVFLMTHTANAANARVMLVGGTGAGLRLAAPRNGSVQTVDRFAHFTAGFELVRERPAMCEGECSSCDYDPPLSSEFLAAAFFQFLETGECYQPGAED
jgi:hypothetical protein